MGEEYLTQEMLDRALNMGCGLPSPPVPIILHSTAWESFRQMLNLTEEQMNRIALKTDYIELGEIE